MATGGVWQMLPTPAGFEVNTALLLTDGTVICQEDCGFRWTRLTPDPMGDYLHGQWSDIPSMIDSRRYYASAVLRDGRVMVAGGEDSVDGEGRYIAKAEIWDPSRPASGWTAVATPPGWNAVGDAPCCVLADGRLLVGSIKTTDTALYDPINASWIAAGIKHDLSFEETWTLLPDGSVLCIQTTDAGHAERYIPEKDAWVSAGETPPGLELVQPGKKEIGAAILMPDRRVLVLGATGHSAIYAPSQAGGPESWIPGPDLPKGDDGKLMWANDSPACLLPNGRVLCAVGPFPNLRGEDWPLQTCFCEFDGTNFVRVSDPIPIKNSGPLYEGRLLVLPDGQVLYTNSTRDVYVYRPNGTFLEEWRPTIDQFPNRVSRGRSYSVSGTQLNGLSQACSYGDDVAMATNYPLVRIRHDATGRITYCLTYNHSTMGVATGALEVSTIFDTPQDIPAGASELCVVANGIESNPVAIVVA